MELRKKESREATRLTQRLKCRLDSGKIRLIEKEATATAVDAILRTLEVLTLRLQPCLPDEPLLHENHSHALEHTSLWVPLWEVEGLRLTVWEYPICHPNPLLQLLSIGSVNGASLPISHINLNKPICLLLWLLGIRLWCLLWHSSS